MDGDSNRNPVSSSSLPRQPGYLRSRQSSSDVSNPNAANTNTSTGKHPKDASPDSVRSGEPLSRHDSLPRKVVSKPFLCDGSPSSTSILTQPSAHAFPSMLQNSVKVVHESMPSLERHRCKSVHQSEEYVAYSADRPPYIPSSSTNNIIQSLHSFASRPSSRASSSMSGSTGRVAGSLSAGSRRRTLSKGVAAMPSLGSIAGGPEANAELNSSQSYGKQSHVSTLSISSASPLSHTMEMRSTSMLSGGSNAGESVSKTTSRLPSTVEKPVLHIYPRKAMVGRSPASLGNRAPASNAALSNQHSNFNSGALASSANKMNTSVSASGWAQYSANGSGNIHKSVSTVVGPKAGPFNVRRSVSLAKVSGMAASKSYSTGLKDRALSTMGGITTPFKNRGTSTSSNMKKDASLGADVNKSENNVVVPSTSAPSQSNSIPTTDQRHLSWFDSPENVVAGGAVIVSKDSHQRQHTKADAKQSESPRESTTSADGQADQKRRSSVQPAQRPSSSSARRLSAPSKAGHFPGNRRLSADNILLNVPPVINNGQIILPTPDALNEHRSPLLSLLSTPPQIEKQASNVSDVGPMDDSYRQNPEYYEYLMLCQRHASMNFITKIASADLVYDDEGLKAKMVGPYLLGDQIGKGSFGKVKEGLCSETLQRVAVKVINKKRLRKLATGIDNIIREIKLLRRLKHRNCITLINVYCKVEDDECSDGVFPWFQEIEDEPIVWKYDDGSEVEKNAEVLKWYMALEYCPCSLRTLIEHDGKLTVERARGFFVQLMEGLAYLHSQSIVHRDIKPGNLLITTDGTLKLTDYGIMEEFSHYEPGELMTTTFAGTHQFISSEIAAGATIFSGTKVDIWASGVTLFNMLTAGYPFQFPADGTLMGLYERIINATWDTPPEIDAELEDLLRCILNKDPDERYTITQILAHSWCQSLSHPASKSSKLPPLLVYPIIDDNRGRSDDDTNSSTAYDPNTPTSPLRPVTLRPIDELRDSLGSASLGGSSSPLGIERRLTASTAATIAHHDSGSSSMHSVKSPASAGDHIHSHHSPLSPHSSHAHRDGILAASKSPVANEQTHPKQKDYSATHNRAWTGSRGQIIEPTETTLIPYLDVLYGEEVEAEIEKNGTIADLLGIGVTGDDKSTASVGSSGAQSSTSRGRVKKWLMGVFKRPSSRPSSPTRATSP
ncbi:hypothetical protein SeMB42_g07104 [Synchytrium endobioticum]|uniref:non-specific serine/threonine protein kinase n=1 Tax=Synchytrium endobioticum TaxID=286115 RepID=A0A507CQW3_9FUNG|nr:hypothetical protein SeMB42_g07104 [Synchytrium endobioticum]TPX41533.1 hypothetical protein SeLEV6574_g06042 [Synchytrium endobioticum]